MKGIVALSFVIGLALGVATTLGVSWSDCRLVCFSGVPAEKVLTQLRVLHEDLGRYLATQDASDNTQTTIRQSRCFTVRMKVAQVLLYETPHHRATTQEPGQSTALSSLPDPATAEASKPALTASGQPEQAQPSASPRPPAIAQSVTSAPKNRVSTSRSNTRPTLSDESDRRAYSRALRLYEDKHYVQARAQFEIFARSFRHSQLLPNALYWTGETWYAEGQYAKAEAVFLNVATRYPRHLKGADALLKAAYSALRRARPLQARQYLERLQAEYAGSHAALLGQQTYKKLPRLASGLEIVHG